MITTERVYQGLRQVMHPEITRNLVELGMIKNVAIQDGCVTVRFCPLDNDWIVGK